MYIRKPKHILVAPLDWGLGHTTRCVPLIRHILRLGHIPVFAGNAAQRSYIEETFPGIDNIHLDGYNVRYSAWNRVGQAGLLAQLPRIMNTISAEQKWLKEVCISRRIDGIISDNRYGLHHDRIPSVIVTHQLHVLSGMGRLTDGAVQKMHYKLLKQFQAIWVPDVEGDSNLAGRLSHPLHVPQGSHYVGLLSQFSEEGAMQGNELVVLISGPEPQRTALSRILWQQVIQYKGQVNFIEGSAKAMPPASIPHHITYYSRLTGKELLPVLKQAGTVICRSGYSTLMDLLALRKNAILIPTPGQTEQLYLARRLEEQKLFYTIKQNSFDLGSALEKACEYKNVCPAENSFQLHKKVLEDWIATL